MCFIAIPHGYHAFFHHIKNNIKIFFLYNNFLCFLGGGSLLLTCHEQLTQRQHERQRFKFKLPLAAPFMYAMFSFFYFPSINIIFLPFLIFIFFSFEDMITCSIHMYVLYITSNCISSFYGKKIKTRKKNRIFIFLQNFL